MMVSTLCIHSIGLKISNPDNETNAICKKSFVHSTVLQHTPRHNVQREITRFLLFSHILKMAAAVKKGTLNQVSRIIFFTRYTSSVPK